MARTKQTVRKQPVVPRTYVSPQQLHRCAKCKGLLTPVQNPAKAKGLMTFAKHVCPPRVEAGIIILPPKEVIWIDDE